MSVSREKLLPSVPLVGAGAPAAETPVAERPGAVVVPGSDRGGFQTAVSRGLVKAAIIAAVVVVIGCIWELVVVWFHMPRSVLPSPVRVLRTMLDNRSYLASNMVPTVVESAVGYGFAVLLAVPTGLLLARPGKIATAMNTGVLSMQIFPKVAVAPLLVVWFGFGYGPKFFFVFILGFFPIAISSSAGFSSAPKELRDLGRVLKMSRTKQVLKLYGPHALPQIFTGMKISAAFAMTAAIVYEFVGANAGLGYIIQSSQANIATDLMFAALIVVTLLGFAFYGIVVALESVAIPWHVSKRR